MYLIIGVLMILLLILGIIALIDKYIWSGINIIGFSILLGICLFCTYKNQKIDKHEYTVLTKITTSETNSAAIKV